MSRYARRCPVMQFPSLTIVGSSTRKRSDRTGNTGSRSVAA